MMMDGSRSDHPAHRPTGYGSADQTEVESAGVEMWTQPDDDLLEELVTRLEREPEECRRACEGLESLDVETRLSIIERLGGIAAGAGVIGLLKLLAASQSTETSAAALAVERRLGGSMETPLLASHMAAEARIDPGVEPARGTHDLALGSSRRIVMEGDQARPRLVNCLVTAIDGMGRGSVAISATRQAERNTAVFLCDVERGIIDAVGQVEEETQAAGALLEDAKAAAGVQGIDGIPELALRLLAGCLSLSGPATPRPVMQWLELTLGRGFEPRPLPAPAAMQIMEPAESSDLLQRANEVLRVCPTWLDRSPLTFELAEEVCLREGRVAVDPRRDSGAFRFLFEHRIIHRLELYRRMLLWMHWFWDCAAEPELAGSARILAWQLSDEQFAVPSNPFTVALTALSLDAARDGLGSEDDPRMARART
jgi:hypothetical protein